MEGLHQVLLLGVIIGHCLDTLLWLAEPRLLPLDGGVHNCRRLVVKELRLRVVVTAEVLLSQTPLKLFGRRVAVHPLLVLASLNAPLRAYSFYTGLITLCHVFRDSRWLLISHGCLGPLPISDSSFARLLQQLS